MGKNLTDTEEFMGLFRSILPPCATKVQLLPMKGGQGGAAPGRATGHGRPDFRQARPRGEQPDQRHQPQC